LNTNISAIYISGRVQGVGFRPFIYNLATKYNIKGFVTNNEFGVFIIANAIKKDIDAFYKQIAIQKPVGARINTIRKEQLDSNETYTSFFIKPTEPNLEIDLPLTPDFAICNNCSEEMLDSKNRRYYYPFTTCTKCGPRYSITKNFPFERENTAMHDFRMCTECTNEYKNNLDIRFHSQTNSCPNCGITLELSTNSGEFLSKENTEIFKIISEKLELGKIIALKNTAGYLLICDATNQKAVQELRIRKKRVSKPFAVLFKDTETIKKYLNTNEIEEDELKSVEAPIVILTLKNGLDLALNEIAPNLATIGALLPNSGTLKLLTENFKKPIIATSGNFHGSPICSTKIEAIESLRNIADYFLHNSLEIQHAQDDSVVKFSEKYSKKIILRRSRGFAPNVMNFKTPKSSHKVLCLGGDLKNTITVLPNTNCYISEYIGDLGHYDTFLKFEKTIGNYFKIFNFKPDVVLFDKHPQYESSRYSKMFMDSQSNIHFQDIQHHKAHFSALLGEKNLWETPEKILGIIWDGMGYGAENEIWGGEFFTYQNNSMERIGHLEYYPWILGDKMSKNPKISALSISEANPVLKKYFDDNEWNVFSKNIQNATIKTSSIGRLFDAVSFILGFNGIIRFEGEASMYLEKLGQKQFLENKNNFVDYLENMEFTNNGIPTKLLFERIILENNKDSKAEVIALNFHYTLIKAIEKIAIQNNCNILAFSGGVFQNTLLIDLIMTFLSKDFRLHFHENISPNDENISFGQLNYYQNIKN
jgi:hydrogenase maturation protein HypF